VHLQAGQPQTLNRGCSAREVLTVPVVHAVQVLDYFLFAHVSAAVSQKCLGLVHPDLRRVVVLPRPGKDLNALRPDEVDKHCDERIQAGTPVLLHREGVRTGNAACHGNLPERDKVLQPEVENGLAHLGFVHAPMLALKGAAAGGVGAALSGREPARSARLRPSVLRTPYDVGVRHACRPTVPATSTGSSCLNCGTACQAMPLLAPR
jgi:hypothetical protein